VDTEFDSCTELLCSKIFYEAWTKNSLIYLCNKQELVGIRFTGDHLLLRDSGPYEIIFTNICAVITVAMAMLLRDFRPSSSSLARQPCAGPGLLQKLPPFFPT
jgi:hypothetical protein